MSVNTQITKGVAGAAIIGAMVLGANAIVGSNSSASTTAGPPGFSGAAPAQDARSSQGGVPPGMGTPVTGTTLTKLTEAATAKYPGTIERAMKLADGTYVVHVIQSNGAGEVHVLVNKSFDVTGVDTRGPGGPPPGTNPS
jgi:hypothetical protein